jgi:hypothetical protein
MRDERERLRRQKPKPGKVQWESAGSYKDEDGIWRGGVVMGSYASADARAAGTLQDCRGWGQYMGRIYIGKGGAVMVVVVAYAPGSTYGDGDRECWNYSQRLGERAAATTSGEQATKWKPGGKPPKPTAEQTKHPKRLLMADLVMHLKHYALKIALRRCSRVP